MTVLSVRLDEELEEQLLLIMQKKKLQDKTSLVRQMLAKSLEKEIIDLLCEEVKEKKVSAWKAASIAKISLGQMLQELAKREVYTIMLDRCD
jgi:predicted HTH domain antitoxin